ncbi:MAG: hypothetical protein M0Z76_01480 [Gammaproteobacteria bacterium]|nr:hypothetical protein [Gammaproteobacteria bacterium]
MAQHTDAPPDTTKRYTPVACDLHDRYECAILLRQTLNARWQDGGDWHEGVIHPVAVETVAGEEFLTFAVQGLTHRVRLDRIHLR